MKPPNAKFRRPVTCEACGRAFISIRNSGIPGTTWQWLCTRCGYNNSPGGQTLYSGMIHWREMGGTNP